MEAPEDTEAPAEEMPAEETEEEIPTIEIEVEGDEDAAME